MPVLQTFVDTDIQPQDSVVVAGADTALTTHTVISTEPYEFIGVSDEGDLLFDYDVIMENQFIYANAGDDFDVHVAYWHSHLHAHLQVGLIQPMSPVGSALRLLPQMTPHSLLYAFQRLTLGLRKRTRGWLHRLLTALLTAQQNSEQSCMQQCNIAPVALLMATHLLIQWAWVPPPCP
jgi:hypothetical protein